MTDEHRVELESELLSMNALALEDRRKLLRQRRIELARGNARQVDEGATIEIVEFLMDGDSYAFDLEFLLEARPLTNVTSIPLAQSFIKGVIPVRGMVVPVIDLLAFIGHRVKERHQVYNKAIILKDGQQLLGVIVDEVIGVREVKVDQFQEAFHSGTTGRLDFFKGISNERMILIDSKRVLADKRVRPDKTEQS